MGCNGIQRDSKDVVYVVSQATPNNKSAFNGIDMNIPGNIVGKSPDLLE